MDRLSEGDSPRRDRTVGLNCKKETQPCKGGAFSALQPCRRVTKTVVRGTKRRSNTKRADDDRFEKEPIVSPAEQLLEFPRQKIPRYLAHLGFFGPVTKLRLIFVGNEDSSGRRRPRHADSRS